MPVLRSPAGCFPITKDCYQLLGGFSKKGLIYTCFSPLAYQRYTALPAIGAKSAPQSECDLSCSCLNAVTTPAGCHCRL